MQFTVVLLFTPLKRCFYGYLPKMFQNYNQLPLP